MATPLAAQRAGPSEFCIPNPAKPEAEDAKQSTAKWLRDAAADLEVPASKLIRDGGTEHNLPMVPKFAWEAGVCWWAYPMARAAGSAMLSATRGLCPQERKHKHLETTVALNSQP